MSYVINTIRPKQNISKRTIALLMVAILGILIVGFWASEVRGPLGWASDDFPLLLIPAFLCAASLIITSVIIFCTEEEFDAYTTWSILLMLGAGLAFASWFIPLEFRLFALQFCLIILVGAIIAIIAIVYNIMKAIWSFKFWIVGGLCCVYLIYKISSWILNKRSSVQKQQATEQAIAQSDNVTTLPSH